MSTRRVLFFVVGAFCIALARGQGQTLTVSASQITEYLNTHNYHRAIVDPPASNMVNLTWDSALASVASNYARLCTGEHNPNRKAQYGDGTVEVGENWYGSYSVPADSTLRPAQAVNWFAGEKVDYNYDTNTCNSGQVCGHYTQVVWATSTKVGCGAAYCPSIPGWTASNIVVQYCNYAPAGNWNGARPYIKAAAPTGSSGPAPTGSSGNAPTGSSGNAPTSSAGSAPTAKQPPVNSSGGNPPVGTKSPVATSSPSNNGINRSGSSVLTPIVALSALLGFVAVMFSL